MQSDEFKEKCEAWLKLCLFRGEHTSKKKDECYGRPFAFYWYTLIATNLFLEWSVVFIENSAK